LDAWEQNPHELGELEKNLRDRYPARHPRDILERAADSPVGSFEQSIADTHMGQGIR
jgi:hypothetical protein